MKKYIALLLFITTLTTLLSQKYAYQFGEPNRAELEANSFAKDTAAGAVVISEYAYRTISAAQYMPWKHVVIPEIPNRGYARQRIYGLFPYVIETEFQQKIKILKHHGLPKATVTIPYYNSYAPFREEVIQNVEAWTYNLIDGNIEKTKLKKENILIKALNDTVSQIYFTAPKSQIGSVIEYRYKRLTPLHTKMTGWEFQDDIPKISALFEVLYYDAFIVNHEVKGGYRVKSHIENETPAFTNVNQKIFAGRKATRILFMAENIPALTKHDLLWNQKDHTAGIRSELSATRFVGYVPYADKWKSVEERVAVEATFEKNNYGKPPYHKEIKELIAPLKTEREKIEAIYRFVKQKIEWNRIYALYGNPKDAILTGKGNNAQINGMLLKALTKNKFYAYPVLLSTRSHGRLPNGFPSYNQLNTYVVCVHTKNGEMYYLDGSATYGGLNVLPAELMVEHARTLARSFMLEEGQTNGNRNLIDVSADKLVTQVMASFDTNGTLSGTVANQYQDIAAAKFKTKYHDNTTKATLFADEMAQKNGCNISQYHVKYQDDLIGNLVEEEFQFSTKVNVRGTTFSLNPLIFTHHLMNTEIAKQRTLPVELEYPIDYVLTSRIKLPQNVRIAELPDSISQSFSNNKIYFSYQIELQNQEVVTHYKFRLNQVIFAIAELDELRRFFEVVISKNRANIVLEQNKTAPI